MGDGLHDLGTRLLTPVRSVTVAVVVALSLGPVDATSSTKQSLAVFATRDTGYPAGEPTLGILPDDSIVFQAYAKTLKSVDGGRTWVVLHVPPTGDQTLDPYVHVDAVTGRIIASQLFVACQLLSISDDGGASWIDAPTQCGTADHQKLGSGPWAEAPTQSPFYERAVYTCVNHVADTACSVSLDGGRVWGPLVTVFPGADPTAEKGVGAPGVCGGLEGDPVSGPDGTIYVPREYCGRPYVGVSADNGLTWQIHPVVPGAQTRPIAFGGNNPSVTVAEDGTVFFAWTGADWLHRVARSDDRGETWTDLGAVSPDILSTTFPLVMAGAKGRVATAYVGTPDTDAGPDEAPPEARWYLYVTYALDANALKPRWKTVQVTGHPVMIGCIGRHGAACSDPGHDRMLDFNDIALTRTGLVAISYTDSCIAPTCVDSSTSTSNHGMLAIQTRGPRFT